MEPVTTEAVTPVEAAPQVRVVKAVISFAIARVDPEGRVLGEDMAPQQVVLYHPFNVGPEILQQAVQQVEAQLNQG